jgi:hypothetical protein
VRRESGAGIGTSVELHRCGADQCAYQTELEKRLLHDLTQLGQLSELVAYSWIVSALAALYSSSLTCSPQWTATCSSSTSLSARWTISRPGLAPCQCSSSGSM